jgi:Ca2+-binding RTX toxin-like protein
VKVKVVVLGALATLCIAGAALAAESVVIRGTSGNDVLTGTPGPDRIYARAGDDQVSALDGNDRVFGSWGNDSLDLGNGDDFARGGPGADTILGGDGNDHLRGRRGPDSIDGGAGNDVIHGGRGADHLQGGLGDDKLFMLARDRQADVADCGPGNDQVWVNVKEDKDSFVNCETVFRVSVTREQSAEDDS